MIFIHVSITDPKLEPQTHPFIAMQNCGKTIPQSTLISYGCQFNSSIAYIVADEPEHAVFLPQDRESQDFCLGCAHSDPVVASTALFQASATELKLSRSRARALALKLPESFLNLSGTKLPFEAQDPDMAKAIRWHIRFRNGMLMINGAMIFRTDTQLFGITYCPLKEGDQVWILDGAVVPVCLRPVSDRRYRYIGELCIEGIMDGEAIPFCDKPVPIELE